ncbi:DsbA family protein [Paraferrimonas sp. SM1919]|uniref:DsbA family oxidoreductase n=1 Tax=Paraferrimonas sp. SM1919 TaxID=2662263 RepID=UPI0013D0127F|nr:DsbA family protein [Paraferrimonas sp. SM1919]
MIQIDYYSDVLCVWAYTGQRRIDQLKQAFGDKIQINYKTMNLFGNGKNRVESKFADKGGLAYFGNHVNQVIAKFPHVAGNDKLWSETQPESSIPAHLAIAAVGLIAKDKQDDYAWAIRQAFFAQGKDIAQQAVLVEIAQSLAIDSAAMQALINNGQAHSILWQDNLSAIDAKVTGSPTLIFNEDRQSIFGNVSYDVMRANVQALIDAKED